MTSLSTSRRQGQADMERNVVALRKRSANSLRGRRLSVHRRVNERKPYEVRIRAAQAQLDTSGVSWEKDLVSLPAPSRHWLRESPPYQIFNSAYIDIPGPYEKGSPRSTTSSPPDPSWSAKIATLHSWNRRPLFTSVHEVWPGHF